MENKVSHCVMWMLSTLENTLISQKLTCTLCSMYAVAHLFVEKSAHHVVCMLSSVDSTLSKGKLKYTLCSAWMLSTVKSTLYTLPYRFNT